MVISHGMAIWILRSLSGPPSSRITSLYMQVGAGIVADSIPRLEWKETINKARSICQAAAMAEAGLDLQGVAVENQRIYDQAEQRPVVGLTGQGES